MLKLNVFTSLVLDIVQPKKKKVRTKCSAILGFCFTLNGWRSFYSPTTQSGRGEARRGSAHLIGFPKKAPMISS